MSQGHEFIFQPGAWIGEGKIAFSASPDHLHFYTKWEVAALPDPDVIAIQKVEMQGASESVSNRFKLSGITEEKFHISLKNEMVGEVTGTGIVDPRSIAWEFRGNENFEGFEVFEIQEGGDYMFHAEYTSQDQFRTIIDGRIWRKR